MAAKTVPGPDGTHRRGDGYTVGADGQRDDDAPEIGEQGRREDHHRHRRREGKQCADEAGLEVGDGAVVVFAGPNHCSQAADRHRGSEQAQHDADGSDGVEDRRERRLPEHEPGQPEPREDQGDVVGFDGVGHAEQPRVGHRATTVAVMTRRSVVTELKLSVPATRPRPDSHQRHST